MVLVYESKGVGYNYLDLFNIYLKKQFLFLIANRVNFLYIVS